jgi:hypothetical protein
MTVIAVLAWNLYVISYNRINHDTYFLIRARPIWSIAQSEIAVVWNHITNYWYYSYYYHRTFQFYFLVTIAGLVYLKRVNKVVIVPVVFLFSGSACYFLLFFVQFRDHDYYFITLMPAIILVVTNSFICLKSKYPGIINSSVAKIVIAALCLVSLRFAHERVAERYANASDNFAGIGTKMASVRQYFDASGVPEDAKIVIITDQSPNGGLYFLNRPGWNLWDTSALCKFLLKKHIREGADYILFTEKEYLDLKVDGWKIGEVNGVTIFKVKTRS